MIQIKREIPRLARSIPEMIQTTRDADHIFHAQVLGTMRYDCFFPLKINEDSWRHDLGTPTDRDMNRIGIDMPAQCLHQMN